MMEAVKKGGDRQKLHEKIRQYSMEAGRKVKEEGLPNDLLSRIESDNEFNIDKNELDSILDAKKYIGRAAVQVEEFVENYIKPVTTKEEKYNGNIEMKI